MSIEQNFDIPFIAALALKEKQIQQNYRPIIAVHKWFARRPGCLFRGLVLAEFGDRPVSDAFYEYNDFPGRLVVDPFMGGGTPLLEANRVGCDVKGFDINPMAAWIVREEIEHLDIGAYQATALAFVDALSDEISQLYLTDCPRYGDRGVPVKYFLWVKVISCDQCGRDMDLFPGYLIADDARHTAHVLICRQCGELNEVHDPRTPNFCCACKGHLQTDGPAKRNRCKCLHCGHLNSFPRRGDGPPRHRMFGMEYHNPHRRNEHRGRFFKKPDANDLARYAAACERFRALEPHFVPGQKIPPGDETDRLHRWGYANYHELFNPRQLLSLELSCRHITTIDDLRVRKALATNLSDLLRYQNMLCRYDTTALKSLDIFSVHGFPVGLVQCESNFLGIINGGGVNVGSGGWLNIIEKYTKAKRYCAAPFEIRPTRRKALVPIAGEWIGERLNGHRSRSVLLACASSRQIEIEPESVDAVFTDPPYFGNVQYGELMDFCYVWLRQLMGAGSEGLEPNSARSDDELTGNTTRARGIEQFVGGLSDVYARMSRALKPGAPLAFTFHHNDIGAYCAVGVAILDAGLACSASLPCPAEMGGSIHIHGTGSSIIDTVFVCRAHGKMRREHLFEDLDGIERIVRSEITQLEGAGVRPTAGDIRCIVYGHLTRMTIWRLRADWDSSLPARARLERFEKGMAHFGDHKHLLARLAGAKSQAAMRPVPAYRANRNAVSV